MSFFEKKDDELECIHVYFGISSLFSIGSYFRIDQGRMVDRDMSIKALVKQSGHSFANVLTGFGIDQSLQALTELLVREQSSDKYRESKGLNKLVTVKHPFNQASPAMRWGQGRSQDENSSNDHLKKCETLRIDSEMDTEKAQEWWSNVDLIRKQLSSSQN